jgi:hypothetical protein
MTSKRRLRRQLGKLRCAIRAGMRSGKAEPLEMAEIKAAARQAREAANRILENHGLAFPNDRKPVPAEAFHDLDLAGRDDTVRRRSIRTSETPDDLKALLFEAIDRPYEP